ncbi:AAA family ATPase [Mammaliicoccus sciuri]|uniref:AAA family ATPase n=1 Tax=Mammaliicoccus sciuri TaxID=1296 RepID=UPI001FB46D4A|nr:AAA family ATPase [Mammaliicoccus sciuri]MCJ0943933.1 AAA family ATPase [Mammaliicoccus sciuri]
MEINIFTGPLEEFYHYLSEQRVSEYHSFMELIREYNTIVRASDLLGSSDMEGIFNSEIEKLVIFSNDFASVTTHVITNFINIITLGRHIKQIYVHNPPKRVKNALYSLDNSSINESFFNYSIPKISDVVKFYNSLTKDDEIVGQSEAKKQISIDIFRHLKNQEKQPFVSLFYGPSGVGKTELAKKISELFEGEITRIQFSMMQGEEAFKYIFGDEHAKVSLAKDLLDRKSNIILIDEFDKVSPIYYNVFYQMFDEGIIEDANYKVDVTNCIFILTSNFFEQSNIIGTIGEPIFSRIDSIIEFSYLNESELSLVINKIFNDVYDELTKEEKQIVDESNLLQKYQRLDYEIGNIRYLNKIIKNDIYTILFTSFLQNQ